MTEQRMLELAERCRRLGRLCQTPAIARKFEALAADYEDYARLHRRTSMTVEILDPSDAPQTQPSPDVTTSNRAPAEADARRDK